MTKSNYVVDDKQKIISAVIADLTEKEKKEIKNYMEFGYKLNSVQRPKKEKNLNSIYSAEKVQKFLEENATPTQINDYWKIYNEQALDSKTKEPLVYKKDSTDGKHKKGDPRVKGHIATLQWFKENFKNYESKL